MRVSLHSDPAEFVKQIADARRFLTRQETGGSAQAAMTSRLMTASLIPFLAALRTELRTDGFDPNEVFTATAELVGNIAMTLIQSLTDAPEEEQVKLLDRILIGAAKNATATIAQDARTARDSAEKARPKLAVVPKDMESGANVVPIKPAKKGK